MTTRSVVNADKCKILVVESNPRLTRKLLSNMQATGHHVITIGEDEPLGDTIRQEQPALILVVAVHTAVIVTLSEQVRAAQPGIFLPIIALTDRCSPAQHSELIACGINDVLTHPIDQALLLARIQAMLHIKNQFDTLRSHNHQLTHDIADRNARLESALETMQDIDLIKTTLVANVGHELRTPLLQIKAAVSLLREVIHFADTGETLIAMATKAIERLENTVGNITQVAGAENIKIEPVNLDDSVDLALRNLERLWKTRETQRIQKRYSQRLPAVLGDKRAVAQILQHLLDNGLKFSEEQGPVEILITVQGELVEIAVRDYGIGIPEDRLESIFKAFYQVDPSPTRKFDGVGVGLTLSQLLARGMNSQVTVTSAPGEGSTFTFRLPVTSI